VDCAAVTCVTNQKTKGEVMNRFSVAMLFVLATMVSTVVAGESKKTETKIDFKDVRQATAVITIDDADYVIAVRFLPSTALGAAQSALTNRKLADTYCQKALMRHLQLKRASISGMQITARDKDGEFVTYTFTIPKKGVKERKE
jgi:hypothetical protein